MKTILCIAALFFSINSNSYSQSYNWAWAKGAGGHNTDEAYGITTDLTGNVYLTGMFQSPQITYDTITVYNYGDSLGTGDLFVFKFDPWGNALWGRSAGGLNNDYGKSIVTDHNGNVYITGNFSSDSLHFGDTTLVNSAIGLPDMMVLKYDGSGNELWSFNAAGVSISEGIGIGVDPSGNGYVTGLFAGIMGLGDSLLQSHGLYDVFMARFNNLGSVVWAQRSGGINSEFPHGLCMDPSGNACITGSFNSPTIAFGTFGLISSGDYDIFIAKYDTAGNVLWALKEGGGGEDAGKGICTDENANVYITGAFASYQLAIGSNTFINAGGFDMIIAKYDSAGAWQWAKHAGQSGFFDWGYTVQTNHTGLYVSGLFNSDTILFDNLIMTNSGMPGTTDVFLVNYSFAGNLSWAVSTNGNQSEDGACLAIDSLSNCYLAGGFSSSTVMFGGASISNSGIAGYADTFLAKLESTSVSVSETTAHSSLKIFPNPCGDYFYLVGEASAKATITLYNMMGETVLHQNITNSNLTRIDCKHLPGGIYTLTYVMGEGLLKGMMVKR